MTAVRSPRFAAPFGEQVGAVLTRFQSCWALGFLHTMEPEEL